MRDRFLLVTQEALLGVRETTTRQSIRRPTPVVTS
uniref:Uncharacterized protein n=1 Tax=Arundo donax TaxID=35708 RepID=A0A0A8ZWP5_ARUDO